MDTAKAIELLKEAQAAINAALAELAPAPAPTKPAPAPTPAPSKPVGRAPENPISVAAGLDYAYFEGTWTKLPDYTKLTPVTTGTIAQPSLNARKREDFFGLRFTGFVSVPSDAEYTFYTTSDDGSKLYIGTTLVVDNDGGHAAQERSGKILLQKGLHALTLDYFDYTGAQQLDVSYSAPGVAKAAIPASGYFRLPTIAKPATEPVKPPAEAPKPTPKPVVTDFTATPTRP